MFSRGLILRRDMSGGVHDVLYAALANCAQEGSRNSTVFPKVGHIPYVTEENM